ncbi:MAG: hypothetical protein ACUVX8_15400 [Candidatus Zipacnadales bacterium]
MSHWLALLTIIIAAATAEWLTLRGLLQAPPPPLIMRNYRDAEIVGRGGVTFAAPLLVGAAVALLLPLRGMDRLGLAGVVLGLIVFGLLGWLDDAWGTPDTRGLCGHIRLLVRCRQVTTGLVKAVGGGLVSLWIAYMLGVTGWAILAAGALIALSANALNALDVRPGRAAKAFLAAAVLLLLWGWYMPLPPSLVVLASLLGGMLVFVGPDLRERVLLGDTGANPLGCVLGIATVSLTPWPSWIILSVLLFALCVVMDRWSLTTAVERSPVLYWLDRLGRPNPRL